MDEQHLRSIPEIDDDDWEQTPVSVRKIVVQLILKGEARPELKELPQSTNFRPPQSAAGKEKETNGKKAGRATGSSRS